MRVAESLINLLSSTPQPRIESIDLSKVNFGYLDVDGTFDKFLKQLEGCLGNTNTTIIFPANIPAEKQRRVEEMLGRLKASRVAVAPLVFKGPGSQASDSSRPGQIRDQDRRPPSPTR